MPSTPTISHTAESQRSAGPGVEEHFNSSLHAVIIFPIATLGGYLQLQYHSQNKSLLEEHWNIMVAIFVNLLMYGMGLMTEFKLKSQRSRRLSIIKRITPLFGILVVVLIMIILYPVLGFVALIICLVTMETVIKLFDEFLQWFRPIVIDIITTYFNGAENHFPGIQENGSASMEMEANDFLRENEPAV